jgi:hypothetical protein
MGQTNSRFRATAAAGRPSAARPRHIGPPLRRYILRFQTTVVRVDDATAWRRRHVRHAVEQLREPTTWSDYISAAFKQAGDLTSDPALFSFKTKIHEISDNFIRGTLTWIGSAVEDPAKLVDGLEWFIGDRMAQYGLQDDDEGWFGITLPTYVRIGYPRLQDFPLEPLPSPAWMYHDSAAAPPPSPEPELILERAAEVVYSRRLRSTTAAGANA